MRFDVELPRSLAILTYETSPGVWIIDATMNARDVHDRETMVDVRREWRGVEPSKKDVALAVASMIAHEAMEQLGCDPHEDDTRSGTIVW